MRTDGILTTGVTIDSAIIGMIMKNLYIYIYIYIALYIYLMGVTIDSAIIGMTAMVYVNGSAFVRQIYI